MSRSSSTTDTSNAGRDTLLAPTDQPESDLGGAAGGTFRLDAMSPGTDASAAFGAPRKTKAATQIVFFMILIAATGGVVFSMRKMGIGPLKSFAEVQVPEYDVTRNNKETGEQRRILDELSRAFTTVQVPAEQVQKNPFVLADALSPTPEEDTSDADKTEAQKAAAAERAKRDAENRKKGIESRLALLKIHAILRGTVPVARIGDEMVRVGDTLSETFLVKAINERSVELDADGVTYLLSLDEEPTRKGAPRRRK